MAPPARFTGRFGRPRSNTRRSNAVRRLAKMINMTSPILVRSGKNFINSVPAHNYQLKIRRPFRQNARIDSQLVITVDALRALVYKELGIGVPSSGTGNMFYLHGIKVYAAVNTDADFQVVVFDIEETATGDANISSSFTCAADESGIGFIHFVYPINNRPTFNTVTPGTQKIITIDKSSADIQLTIDYDLTFVRTPTSSISLREPLRGAEFLGSPQGPIASLPSHSPISISSSLNELSLSRPVDAAELRDRLQQLSSPGPSEPSSGELFTHHCPTCNFSFLSGERLAAHFLEEHDDQIMFPSSSDC
jgi:hypothetical protein